jgi:hypothetical protein
MNTTDKPHPDVDILLAQLADIDLTQLDVQQQLITLRAGQDWNFFVIPITVLLLLAGVAIGLNFEKMIWGFIGGATLALLVGYAYHLWDMQWKKVATQKVVEEINAIEGDEGFLPWFKPILAKSTYRVMFYKLTKRQQIEVEDYVRAIHRLRGKNTDVLRARLLELYPIPEPEPEPDATEQEGHPVEASHQHAVG